MPVYLINAQTLFAFQDWRWVAQQLLDTNPGTVATLSDMLDPNTTAGARLQTLIGAASEMLLAAACGQARYSLQDIQTYGGSLRDMIVANLAVGPILSRRDRAADDEEKLSLSYKQALDYLEQLQKGERIFYAVPNVPEAGLAEAATMTPRPGIDPPLSTKCATRYFGSGRPTGSGGCAGGC